MNGLDLIKQASNLLSMLGQVCGVAHDVIVWVFSRKRPDRHIVAQYGCNAIIRDGGTDPELECDLRLDLGRACTDIRNARAVLRPSSTCWLPVKLIDVCRRDIAKEVPQLVQERNWAESKDR